MAYTRIPLAISPGLVLDDTAFAIGTAGLRDVNLMRPYRGALQVMSGWEAMMQPRVTGLCRDVFGWWNNSNRLQAAFGSHERLELYEEGALHDITPVGLAAGEIDGIAGIGYGTGAYGVGPYSVPYSPTGFPRTWSLANYGGDRLIANPRGGPVFMWDGDTANRAVALTGGAPEVSTVAAVAPSSQVLAFGCTEHGSTTFNPRAIRASDINNPNDWTITSSNNADENTIESDTPIVGAAFVRDFVFVWTRTELWQGQFTGDTTRPWDYVRLGQLCGLIGPNARVVIGSTAYWLSPSGQVWRCTINGTPEMVVSPLTRDWAKHTSPAQGSKIVAFSNTGNFNEVGWFYPDSRDGIENNRFYALDLTSGLWWGGRLSRTAFVDATAAPFPIGVDPDGQAFFHERGNSANGAVIPWYMETGFQYVEESQRRFRIISVYPDVDDQVGNMEILLKLRDEPQGTEYTRGPKTLTPNMRKTGLRGKGRLVSIRLQNTNVPGASFARINRFGFDTVALGLK